MMSSLIENSTNYLISLRRTWVPIAAGAIVTWAAAYQFDVPLEDAIGVLQAIVTGVLYAVARLLESRFPLVGTILLGAARQPDYTGQDVNVTVVLDET